MSDQMTVTNDPLEALRNAQQLVRQLEAEQQLARDEAAQEQEAKIAHVLSKLLTLCGIEVATELTVNDFAIGDIRFRLTERGSEYFPEPGIVTRKDGSEFIYANLNVIHVLTDDELNMLSDGPMFRLAPNIRVNGLELAGSFTHVAAEIADAIDSVNTEYERFAQSSKNTIIKAVEVTIELSPVVVLEYQLGYDNEREAFQKAAAALIQTGYKAAGYTAGCAETEVTHESYSIVSAMFILTAE